MITRIPDLPPQVIGLTATGKVTANDYASVVIPAVTAALKAHKKVRLLYHIGPDCSGFTAGALWDDTKVGFSHLTAWEKIAVVTDTGWIRNAMGMFGFIIPGEVKLFANHELAAALDWVASS